MTPPSPHGMRVDVWAVDLDAGHPDDHALLSPAERARADAFRFDRHRTRYTSAHAWVRRLLADQLGTPPERIEFGALEHGKPVLVDHPDVHVNLSHSANVGLFALGSSELGVDVECGPADLAVATRFFSRDEQVALLALPPGERDAAFLACWARKEAYLKAKRGGLAFPLDRFAVSLRPTEAARLLWSDLDAPGEQWTLVDLTPQLPDFAPPAGAALVFQAAPNSPHSVVVHATTRDHAATSQGV